MFVHQELEPTDEMDGWMELMGCVQQLYSHQHFGTKIVVGDLIRLVGVEFRALGSNATSLTVAASQVIESIILVRDSSQLTDDQKRDFFRRSKQLYGRTALMLSGGECAKLPIFILFLSLSLSL